ncbi:MAG: hypothetical protein EZS28_037645 [Streblomastix strix]|uniref:Uncharacterized protein n=1 Tax=Streblomastix strix TaxID=222440 RepID=A0A5J4U8U0_9EUKA|nr:MAG: hypothetical protein EZS28_037645 [Streblomastix strix]
MDKNLDQSKQKEDEQQHASKVSNRIKYSGIVVTNPNFFPMWKEHVLEVRKKKQAKLEAKKAGIKMVPNKRKRSEEVDESSSDDISDYDNSDDDIKVRTRTDKSQKKFDVRKRRREEDQIEKDEDIANLNTSTNIRTMMKQLIEAKGDKQQQQPLTSSSSSTALPILPGKRVSKFNPKYDNEYSDYDDYE